MFFYILRTPADTVFRYSFDDAPCLVNTLDSWFLLEEWHTFVISFLKRNCFNNAISIWRYFSNLFSWNVIYHTITYCHLQFLILVRKFWQICNKYTPLWTASDITNVSAASELRTTLPSRLECQFINYIYCVHQIEILNILLTSASTKISMSSIGIKLYINM